MKPEQRNDSRDERMVRLSSKISYSAIIEDNKEVEITREMMEKACQKMEMLQSFPFNCAEK